MTDEIRVELTEAQLEELLNGKRDAVRVPDTHKQPNTTPISEVSLDQTYDLMGVVRTVNDINHFDRDDGDEGQVRNVRIQDRTGDLRVALWGEHADVDLSVGDYVHCLGVEIQDGYQDTFEGSIGWDSSIYVVEEPEDADKYVTVEVAEEPEGDVPAEASMETDA